MPDLRNSFLSLHFKSIFYVVGLILTFASFSMFLPLATAYIYNEQQALYAFEISALCCIITGLLLYFPLKRDFKPKSLRHREACFVVTFSWIAIAGFAALPYLLSGSFTHPDGLWSSFTQAYFESMSGLTTTGASILQEIEPLPKSILLWRSQSQWLGGMGIILLSIAILPLLGVGGMQLFKAEVPGISVDKLSPRISETAKTLWLVYIGLTLTELVLLMLGKMPLYEALCHSFSTLSTGGFSPKNNSIEYYDSLYIEAVITFFMFFGGINFALIYKALKGRFKSFFLDLELRYYIGITLISVTLITLSLVFTQDYAPFEAFRYTSFQVVSIMTTTGFSSTNWESWPVFTQTLLLTLMALGGMAGSTAGGAKIIRLIILLKYALRELYTIIHPKAVISIKMGTQPISREVLRSVLAFFIIFCLLVIGTTLGLTAMGIDLLTAFSAAITACGNVGPGLNLVGPAHNFYFMPDTAKWLLIMGMLLGRLEIYTAFVLFVPAFWKR